MNLFDFIYYPFVALLLYVLIAPIVRLTLLKLKYGNSVGIYYFPFIGLIGQIIFDAIIHQDVFYTQKRLKLKNPNLKVSFSLNFSSIFLVTSRVAFTTLLLTRSSKGLCTPTTNPIVRSAASPSKTFSLSRECYSRSAKPGSMLASY